MYNCNNVVLKIKKEFWNKFVSLEDQLMKLKIQMWARVARLDYRVKWYTEDIYLVLNLFYFGGSSIKIPLTMVEIPAQSK